MTCIWSSSTTGLARRPQIYPPMTPGGSGSGQGVGHATGNGHCHCRGGGRYGGSGHGRSNSFLKW